MSKTDPTSAMRAAFARAASRLVLAAALTILIAGCGGKHGVVARVQGTRVELPAADQQALDDAASWYANHCAGGVALARHALVDSLVHGWAGVARAELAHDSTTIVIGFADGYTGALNTNPALAAGTSYDPTAMRNALSGTQPPRAARVDLSTTTRVPARADLLARRPSAFSVRGRTTAHDAALFQAPQSRKVLIIDSSNGSLSADASTPLLEYIKSALVDHYGYAASDIVIRTNLLADNYGSLDFEDFLRLKDFGLIVIMARSVVWDTPDNPEDWRSARTPHFYVEVAERTGYNARHQAGGGGSTERFDVQAEIRKGRVLPTVESYTWRNAPTCLYMRDDLWAEQLDGALPGSVVMLLSPNGGIASPVFTLHGARSLTTWTDSLATQPAADGLWMPLFMAHDNVADVDAARNGYLPDRYGVSQVKVWPDLPTRVYLPTWADVSTANAPTGTQTVRVNATYAASEVMQPEASILEDLPSAVKNFRSMVPAQSVRFLAQALSSSGTVLGEMHVDTLLRTGRNIVALAFPLATSGLSLEASATSVNAASPANVTLVAAVRDGQGNAISGRQVQFSQVPAAGTFVGANPATTNASGLATIVVHTDAMVVDGVRVNMIARDPTSAKADTVAVDYCKSTRYSIWLSGTADEGTFNTAPAGTFQVSGVDLRLDVNGGGPYGIATLPGPTHPPFGLSGLYTSGDHLQFVIRPTATGMSASIGPLFVHVLNCMSHHVYGGGTIGVAPNTQGTLDVTIP